MVVSSGTSGYMDSGGVEGKKIGRKLMALPKRVGNSIGRPERISSFQCTKAREDSFKISVFYFRI